MDLSSIDLSVLGEVDLSTFDLSVIDVKALHIDCFACGKRGHFQRNCPRNRGSVPTSVRVEATVVDVVRAPATFQRTHLRDMSVPSRCGAVYWDGSPWMDPHFSVASAESARPRGPIPREGNFSMTDKQRWVSGDILIVTASVKGYEVRLWS